jgi:hypothetical protein
LAFWNLGGGAAQLHVRHVLGLGTEGGLNEFVFQVVIDAIEKQICEKDWSA